jgi:hypothetical protein
MKQVSRFRLKVTGILVVELSGNYYTNKRKLYGIVKDDT